MNSDKGELTGQSLEQRVIAAIRDVIGQHSTDEPVLLHAPYLPPNAWTYVRQCLDNGWVSTAGVLVSRFEASLSEFIGSRRAIATVNGTAALQVCFHLLGVKSQDEVICPSLTFVATANAIRHQGATPHFVDICRERLSLCPIQLAKRLAEIARREHGVCINRETGRRIAAVCPMHCFGHPCEMDAILEICQQYDLPVVEDAAESLGSTYQGRHTGRFGRLAALSFNGNKILTTGGGGAIVTDDPSLADRALHLTTTAKVPHAWEYSHDETAWNYRMPNLNAALGIAQLECLSQVLLAKRKLFDNYRSALAPIAGLRLMQEPGDSRSNYWLNAIILHDSTLRAGLLQQLNAAGLQCRPLWRPMHTLPMYGDCPRGDMANTEWAYSVTINIPSSPHLGFDHKLQENAAKMHLPLGRP